MGLRAARAEIAAAALVRFRPCRARSDVCDALWLERAAGLAKDSLAWRRAAVDLGMAARRFRLARSARSLLAARHRPCAASRHQAAGDADRAAARPRAHGAGADPRRGNFGAAGAAAAGRTADAADGRH